MKKTFFMLSIALQALLTVPTFASGLDLQDDIITIKNEDEAVLTQEELKAQKSEFVDFITKYKSDVFVGFSQYVFSSLNLSLKAHVKYAKELDGTVSFQMATAGNHQISYSDVTFPMQAKVYFDLKTSTGDYLQFVDQSGAPLTFKGKRNTLYLVETELAFANRKNIQIKHMKDGKAIGRFFAKVEYDLFNQDIEFYEIDTNAKAGNVLVRRGHFKGNVSPSRTGF